MVTTATWASLFPPPPSARLGSPARQGARGEGRSDREGVRDIGRNVRSDSSVRELARPVPHASDVAKYDERPVTRGTSHRWDVLMAVDEHAERPPGDRRTALELRHDHRVPQDLAPDLLRQMPLVPA